MRTRACEKRESGKQPLVSYTYIETCTQTKAAGITGNRNY